MATRKEKARMINKGAVFNAAKEIAKRSEMPTIKKIREQLGGGSETTIHKYLKQWKEACFQQGGKDYSLSETEDSKKLAEEKYYREQQLDKQIQLNKVLSHDLLMAEREIAKLKEHQWLQQKELEALKAHHGALEKQYESLNAAYEAVCLERQTAIKTVLEDKNQFIEKLREELKKTHEDNLAQVREWSFQKEDVLMQEKVKSLNYEAQIKVLKEELKRMSVEYEKAIRKNMENQNKTIQNTMNSG